MFTNLLYVGDVPVEASYHGSALLYRLLSGYPAEKLTVIETAGKSEPTRRLPQVSYFSHPIGKQRWLNTRLHPYAVAWFSQTGTRSGNRIARSLNGFGVEHVLTVAHGFGWLAAAAIAAERNVPLHLMVHDDWPRAAQITPAFQSWLDARFATVYRQAHARFCVSPAMSEFYRQRYGAAAHVIYPSRAQDCPRFDQPPERLADNNEPFTIAFAGTINSKGYFQTLRELQNALQPVGGRLLIFGPLTPDEARQHGLATATTQICGLVHWKELLDLLRDKAHALFVPMSFAAVDRANMEMAFPSKLADCTAVGLPLLIYGPKYCSAVSWARENEGVAEVVETESQLREAVRRLAVDPLHRVSLGQRALETGRDYFIPDRAREIFQRALTQSVLAEKSCSS